MSREEGPIDWAAIPKVELHHHLEGAADPALICAMAQEKQINITGVFDERGHYKYADFPEFLKVYEAATSVLKTPVDYARLTRAVLEGAVDQGVIYLETFLSPDFCGGRDLSAWRDYLAAMQEVADDMADTITLRGIVTCIRHFGPDKAKQTALCAAETAGDFIVGYGMGGDETMGRPRDFAWGFDCAREAGLHLTAHAGEWGDAHMVRDTIDDLHVERIGHGVRAIEGPQLVEYLAASGIVLEVCPASNVALGLYPTLSAHPIARLRDAGVRVTISTDDPPFFHTNMGREYAALSKTFGWTPEDFAALNTTAIEAGFCDDTTREAIAKRLERP